LITILPAFPFISRDVRAGVQIIEQGCLQHGLEPHIALICTSERSIDATVFLMYDRDAPGEDARARDCHDWLLRNLIDQGYLPYRLGIQSMNALPAVSDDSRRFLNRLKAMIDPNNILAPGRYEN